MSVVFLNEVTKPLAISSQISSQKRTSKREETQRSSALVMPVTGWLRGTVKAVPSGDTVLIVANAGPTVRFRSLFYISLFCVVLCRCTFFRGGSPRERPSKQIGRVMFLFLSLMLLLFCSRVRAHRNHRLVLTIKLSRCSLFSNALSRWNNDTTIKQSSGPPPEKIVTLAGIIAPRMVRKFLVTFFTRS